MTVPSKFDVVHTHLLKYFFTNFYYTGVKKWKREYNQSIIPESEIEKLKTSIEEFVHETDTKREETKNKAEEEAEPDDDG